MLQRAKVTWPFHTSNPHSWSSPYQSNIGGWNMSCPCSYCNANRLKCKGIEMELLTSLFDAELGWRVLQGMLTIAQTYTEGLTVGDKICCMAKFDPNWSTMFLKWLGSWKEATRIHFFAITPLIIGILGWNFDTIWAPIVVTSDVSFSRLPSLFWKLACFLCVLTGVLKEGFEYTVCNNFANTREYRTYILR